MLGLSDGCSDGAEDGLAVGNGDGAGDGGRDGASVDNTPGMAVANARVRIFLMLSFMFVSILLSELMGENDAFSIVSITFYGGYYTS